MLLFSYALPPLILPTATFYKEGNGASERFCKLPKVTQPTWAGGAQARCGSRAGLLLKHEGRACGPDPSSASWRVAAGSVWSSLTLMMPGFCWPAASGGRCRRVLLPGRSQSGDALRMGGRGQPEPDGSTCLESCKITQAGRGGWPLRALVGRALYRGSRANDA